MSRASDGPLTYYGSMIAVSGCVLGTGFISGSVLAVIPAFLAVAITAAYWGSR